MSLYLYARTTDYPNGPDAAASTSDMFIGDFTSPTSETTIVNIFLAWIQHVSNPLLTHCVITTDEGGSEVDLKTYDYYDLDGDRFIVPDYILVARRADITEDWEYTNTYEPLYMDTSGGYGDFTDFPGHLAQYIVVYNPTATAITFGQLLSYESNTTAERHFVETRGAGKTTEPPAGVALEAIAAYSWGKMAVAGFCDVACSNDRADTGGALYASSGSGTEDESTTTETDWLVGTAVGGIGSSYVTNWARIQLSLSAPGNPLAEVSDSAPADPATGLIWLDTDALPGGLVYVLADGTIPLSGDWDNTGYRIRNTGAAEVQAAAPATPATGLIWLDTDATPGAGIYIMADGTVPLTADWDNTGQRIRNTGTIEIGTGTPSTPATGLLWLDTN